MRRGCEESCHIIICQKEKSVIVIPSLTHSLTLALDIIFLIWHRHVKWTMKEMKIRSSLAYKAIYSSFLCVCYAVQMKVFSYRDILSPIIRDLLWIEMNISRYIAFVNEFFFLSHSFRWEWMKWEKFLFYFFGWLCMTLVDMQITSSCHVALVRAINTCRLLSSLKL